MKQISLHGSLLEMAIKEGKHIFVVEQKIGEVVRSIPYGIVDESELVKILK